MVLKVYVSSINRFRLSHEEFKTIINEKEKYEQMKESIRNTKSKAESSENSRDIKENNENA